MRHLLFLVFLTLCLVACKSKKSNQLTVTSNDGKEKVSVDMDKVSGANADFQKKTEELQKLSPLSLDQLKALIPEQLSGGKKTSSEATSAMGTALADAEYTINDSAKIKLMIYDCAGPAGVGIYSVQYLGMFNMESENEVEYTKTIDFNSGRAIEKCRKDGSECTLTYFSGDRFLVVLEGEHVSIDQLKQAASSLNIKS